jgi:hypothetical protein
VPSDEKVVVPWNAKNRLPFGWATAVNVDGVVTLEEQAKTPEATWQGPLEVVTVKPSTVPTRRMEARVWVDQVPRLRMPPTTAFDGSTALK